MEFTEALRTFVRLLEATAERPLGLLSLLFFAGSMLAYLLLRDVSPRLTGRLMWLVLASLVAVGFAVSETQQRSPSLRQVPIARGTLPLPATSAPAPASSPAPGGTGVPGAVAPAGGSASGATGEAPGSSSRVVGTRERAADAPAPSRNTWVVAGPLSRELTTRDHRNAARTTYGLRLEVGESERLVRPELECLEGPCASSIVQPPRLAPDGRSVDAWFDVWDAPTRWRLTAARERRER